MYGDHSLAGQKEEEMLGRRHWPDAPVRRQDVAGQKPQFTPWIRRRQRADMKGAQAFMIREGARDVVRERSGRCR